MRLIVLPILLLPSVALAQLPPGGLSAQDFVESPPPDPGLTIRLDIAQQQVALLQQERAILMRQVEALHAGCVASAPSPAR